LLWTALAAALAFGAARPANGQDVFMPPPEFSITPEAVQEYQQENPMQVFTPISNGQPPKPLAEWGPIVFRPHPFYRFLYGNGIASDTSTHVNTVAQTVSPGLLFLLGPHWSLDYTPSWTTYSSHQLRDSLDHNVRLTGGTLYEDWILGFSQTYSKTTTPMVETGTQTEQEIYSTALGASHRINSGLSMDLALNQNLNFTPQFQSWKEWSTMDWLNYQFWPRLSAGLGTGGGYDKVDTGADMTFEQFQARVQWRALDKLAIEAHGGAEIRQFRTAGAGDLVNPVAGASVQYQPFDNTRLSLSVARVQTVALTTAALQSEVTESTGVDAALKQRLFEKLSLDLGGGYHTIKYISAGSDASGRSDKYYSFNARLSWWVFTRVSVAVFYQYSKDSSSQASLTFNSIQEGLELGCQF
jgi:hypothetical protein